MVAELVYLPSADGDLIDIYLAIARDHEPAADRFIERIRAAVMRLSTYPLSAPARPDLGQGVRGMVVGSYILLHKVEADRVMIIRVIHTARDIGAILDADA